MPEALREVYYGLWANFSEFPLAERAGIVVFVRLFLVWFLAWFVLSKAFFLIQMLLDALAHGICIVGETLLFPLWLFRLRQLYMNLVDNLNSSMGKLSERLSHKDANGKKIHGTKIKFHPGWMLLVYVLLMLLILLPDLVGNHVSERYQQHLTYVYTLYRRMESPALKQSMSFEPLFPELLPKVWLALSEEGLTFGATMRDAPSKDATQIDFIYDGPVQYLREDVDEWRHVRYKEHDGWIHSRLLEPLSNRAMPLPEETEESLPQESPDEASE